MQDNEKTLLFQNYFSFILHYDHNSFIGSASVVSFGAVRTIAGIVRRRISLTETDASSVRRGCP
jgi:hypothetical protein